MDNFVIEKFNNGELLKDESFRVTQRLLNENDLHWLTSVRFGRYCRDRKLLFIRREIDVNNGYYISEDGRWDYGTRENALNTIKTRI